MVVVVSAKKVVTTVLVIIVVAAAAMIYLEHERDEHLNENEISLTYEITVDLTLPENKENGGTSWTGAALLVIPENSPNLSNNLVDDVLS